MVDLFRLIVVIDIFFGGYKMCVIMFLLAILALIDGLVTYTSAETIMQQIAGIMVLVLSAVLFSGAAVVDALGSLKREIKKLTGPAEELAKLKEKVRAGSRTHGSVQM